MSPVDFLALHMAGVSANLADVGRLVSRNKFLSLAQSCSAARTLAKIHKENTQVDDAFHQMTPLWIDLVKVMRDVDIQLVADPLVSLQNIISLFGCEARISPSFRKSPQATPSVPIDSSSRGTFSEYTSTATPVHFSSLTLVVVHSTRLLSLSLAQNKLTTQR